MALLDAFLRIRNQETLHLVVAHYEHGIRGTASLEDARFVERFCRERSIGCIVEHGDVPGYAKVHKMSVETAARALRYAFLHRIANAHGACAIALAHHRDDQVETVLMHIFRGAGMRGLKGMRRADGRIYRPLIEATKEEIYAYCTNAGIPYREDATNEIADATRNKIRLELLPYVREKINAAVDDAVIRLSDIAEEEDALLHALTEEAMRISFVFDTAGDAVCVHRSFFRTAPAAIQRRALFVVSARIAGQDGWSYREIESVRQVAGDAKGEKRLSLAGDTELYAGYRWIYLYKAHFDWEKFSNFHKDEEKLKDILEDFSPCEENERKRETLLQQRESIVLREGYQVLPFADCAIEVKRVDCMERMDAWTIYVDGGMCGAGIFVRPRRAGDRIALSKGHRKVKELLIDGKIHRSRRGAIPIVLLGEEILWVAGVRRSIHAYVTEDTKDIMRLRLLWEKSR